MSTGVLGLIRQCSTTVLHARDLSFGIMRVHPLLIPRLLLPPPIHAPQRCFIVGFHASGFR